MLPHLLLVGGEHVVTGVVRIEAKNKKKYWVDGNNKELAVRILEREPGLVAVQWSALQAWCREKEEQGKALPGFVKTSEEQVVSHRRL